MTSAFLSGLMFPLYAAAFIAGLACAGLVLILLFMLLSFIVSLFIEHN